MALTRKIECEAKIPISGLDVLIEKIPFLKPINSHIYTEENFLFEREGELFRLRKVHGKKKILYTKKSDKLPSCYKKKVEYEEELSLKHAARLIRTATYLGKYEKKRMVYTLHEHCAVMLDEVIGLGFFVEVEAPDDEHITQIILKLGLNPADHINESYFSLLQRRK